MNETLQVLLVEDNAGDARLLREMIELQSTPVADAIGYAVNTLQGAADAKGIKLTADFDSALPLPPVCADPMRVRQILIILIDNAIKLVTRQGGRVWVENAPVQGSVFYVTLPVFSPPDMVDSVVRKARRNESPIVFVVAEISSPAGWLSDELRAEHVQGIRDLLLRLKAGAKAFLQKPVDNAELLAVIRQALGEPALPAGVAAADTGEFPLFRG